MQNLLDMFELLVTKSDQELMDLAFDYIESSFGLGEMAPAKTITDETLDAAKAIAQQGERFSDPVSPVVAIFKSCGWNISAPEQGEVAIALIGYCNLLRLSSDGSLEKNPEGSLPVHRHESDRSSQGDKPRKVSHNIRNRFSDCDFTRGNLKQEDKGNSALELYQRLTELSDKESKVLGELAKADGKAEELASVFFPLRAQSEQVEEKESLDKVKQKITEGQLAEHQANKMKVYGNKEPSIEGLQKYLHNLHSLKKATDLRHKKEVVAVINYWKAAKQGLNICLSYNGQICNLGTKDNGKNGVYRLRMPGLKGEEILFDKPGFFPPLEVLAKN